MNEREALDLAIAALHRIIEQARAHDAPHAVYVAGRAAEACQVLRAMRALT